MAGNPSSHGVYASVETFQVALKEAFPLPEQPNSGDLYAPIRYLVENAENIAQVLSKGSAKKKRKTQGEKDQEKALRDYFREFEKYARQAQPNDDELKVIDMINKRVDALGGKAPSARETPQKYSQTYTYSLTGKQMEAEIAVSGLTPADWAEKQKADYLLETADEVVPNSAAQGETKGK